MVVGFGQGKEEKGDQAEAGGEQGFPGRVLKEKVVIVEIEKREMQEKREDKHKEDALLAIKANITGKAFSGEQEKQVSEGPVFLCVLFCSDWKQPAQR